jgi:hypothetical protein
MEAKERLQKMKEKNQVSQPMRQKLEEQLAKLRAHSVLSYLVLMEENLINSTIKLFDLLLYVLPSWLGFKYE